MICAPPRYGTCTTSAPVVTLKNSIARWLMVVAPNDATLTLPGWAFA